MRFEDWLSSRLVGFFLFGATGVIASIYFEVRIILQSRSELDCSALFTSLRRLSIVTSPAWDTSFLFF